MGEVLVPPEEIVRVLKLPYKLPQKLREIINGFKWAIHNKKQSAVIIMDGRSGMGKTTLSFQIARYMTPDFSLDDVHFTPETFLEALTHTKKGDTLVFDEAMLLSSRSALSQINRMIVIAMSMIRSKNLLIIFNVNSIFDLDRNLALSRADLLLHCYGESLTDKGKFLAFFKGGDGIDRIKELYIYGKKYYSYGTPKANFNSTFSSYFVVNEQEYEERKQLGVNKFLKNSKTSENLKYKQSRDKAIYWIYKNNAITQEELAQILGISRRTIINVLNLDENLEKYEENDEKYDENSNSC
jgi:DNA-binding XRE family transcriptional regulator